MSTHRYVATSFWDDDWIQSLDPSEKLLYLYLMTNPLTSISGVYKISDRRISFDTGFNIDTIKQIMGKFEKAGKAYRMDEYVVLPSWPKHQKWETAPKIKEGIVLYLMGIGEKYLKRLIEINYRFDLRIVFDRLGIPYIYGSNYSDLDPDPNIDPNTNINSSGSAERNTEASPPEVSGSSPKKSEKPKKLPLREREPANDTERVEKAYLQNWDALYSQKRVTTADPVVNWNQTRKLLKSHFEKLKPDGIIQAINNGLKDDFVMNGGYTLGMMLSASMLNRLLNTSKGAPPPGLAEKESLTGLKSIF